jgi:uncharacterized membrane protein YedE/YeeE
MDLVGGIVMLALLGIGFSAGFLMHRTDFCVAGAFRDIFLFKHLKLIRPLVLLFTVSALLFEISRLTGVMPKYPFPWFSAPSVGNLIGGAIFGVGMVLAGGCVVGVLYKLGSGNLLAGVALIGLVAGSAVYAEIHATWVGWAKAMALGDAVTLPQLLHLSPTLTALLFVTITGCFCWRWYKTGKFSEKSFADGFVPYWATATGLAVLGLLAVCISSVPMGITTTYAKAAALVESWIIPGHFATVSYFGASSEFVLPFDDVVRTAGAAPAFDAVLIVQLPLILGIAIGSAISALSLGELRLLWKVPKSQIVMAFIGGVIMALGARMSPGCNIWHLWGGLPLLTLQSLLFLLGILPGAWIGSKILNQVVLLETCRLTRN